MSIKMSKKYKRRKTSLGSSNCKQRNKTQRCYSSLPWQKEDSWKMDI